MPEKISIWSEHVPPPQGHYCQAIKYGNTVHISGQLPLDPKTGKLSGADAAAQAKVVFGHMAELVQASGGQVSHILRLTIYLTDLADLPVVEAELKRVFYFLPPARTVVGVAALQAGAKICADALVEIKLPEVGGKML